MTVKLPRLGIVTAVATMFAGATGHAQDPVKLPGVDVKASAPPPGPRLIAGIVVDTSGNTISGAEITIPGLARRLYSGEDGTFRFDSIPRGRYSMRARKIGFAPQVREFKVDTLGGAAEFQLLPIARSLPAMVSSAARGGLAGVIGDTAYNALVDVEIRVMGHGMLTQTDSVGAFFLPVEAGDYMVGIKKDGFAERLVSVTIPPDSGRRITAWLQPLVGTRPHSEAFNIPDFQERLAWIPPGASVGATFYTRDQLLKLDIVWIYDAVQMTASKNRAKSAYDRECMVVVNGGPAVANLATLTIDDVEAVEVYGGGFSPKISIGPTAATGATRNRAPTGQFTKTNNGRNAGFDNHGRSCPTVYVWTR